SGTAAFARRKTAPLARDAVPAGYPAIRAAVTAAPHQLRISPLEVPMTVCTRKAGATGYYLGRSAAFWLTVLAPRSAAHKPPRGRATCAPGPRSSGAAAGIRRGVRTSRRKPPATSPQRWPLLPCRYGDPAQRRDAPACRREELCGPGHGEPGRQPADLRDMGWPRPERPAVLHGGRAREAPQHAARPAGQRHRDRLGGPGELRRAARPGVDDPGHRPAARHPALLEVRRQGPR